MSVKFIDYNFIIVGYGRWSQIYIKTLLRYFLKKTIFVYSKSNFQKLKLEKKILNSNKIKNLKSFIFDKNKKYVLIICNKNNQRKKYINFALKNKIDCICEKPFLLGKNDMIKILKNFKKEKIKFFLSLPWIFNNHISKILKKEKLHFDKIKIEWHEKDNVTKYGLKKIFDKKISFYKDVISHIVSFIYKFIANKKFNLRYKNSSLIFLKKIRIILDLKRNSKKNLRKISFYRKNKQSATIILDKNIKYFSKKKTYIYKDKKRDLDKMILYFLNNNYVKIFKDYSNLLITISKLTTR